MFPNTSSHAHFLRTCLLILLPFKDYKCARTLQETFSCTIAPSEAESQDATAYILYSIGFGQHLFHTMLWTLTYSKGRLGCSTEIKHSAGNVSWCLERLFPHFHALAAALGLEFGGTDSQVPLWNNKPRSSQGIRWYFDSNFYQHRMEV